MITTRALVGNSAIVFSLTVSLRDISMMPTRGRDASEAAALCQAAGALLHVDAVQAAGRCPVNLAALGAHSLAISSHKLGGPPGAGALLLAPGVEIEALVRGGGQERGRRGGGWCC